MKALDSPHGSECLDDIVVCTWDNEIQSLWIEMRTSEDRVAVLALSYNEIRNRVRVVDDAAPVVH